MPRARQVSVGGETRSLVTFTMAWTPFKALQRVLKGCGYTPARHTSGLLSELAERLCAAGRMDQVMLRMKQRCTGCSFGRSGVAMEL